MELHVSAMCRMSPQADTDSYTAELHTKIKYINVFRKDNANLITIPDLIISNIITVSKELLTIIA